MEQVQVGCGELKHQLAYFENKTGPFKGLSAEEAQKAFVELWRR